MIHPAVRFFVAWTLLAAATWATGQTTAPAPADWTPRRPNIVYILCDDLGYGDVQALNPARGKIATPNIDRLVREGLTFRDAHTSSSVCSPSRYALLTGRYSWRSSLQKGALPGLAGPILTPNRRTVAHLFKDQGYATAIFGKWHLGVTFGPDRYKDPITAGPLQHGFDEYFGIAASLDMQPHAYIEADRFLPSSMVPRKWENRDPAAENFEGVDVLPAIAERSIAYIGQRAAAAKAGRQPFFLYLPLTSPHTPVVPSPEWEGRSGLGKYADFVMQTDSVVGRIMKAVDDAGLRENTLAVFTSDNGCAPYIGVPELQAKGHFPSERSRGYKADVWDGGHRVPHIVRWPGVVAAGTTSDVTIGLVDWYRTCAQIVGATVPDDVAEDSVGMLAVLLGRQTTPLREAEVQQSNEGHFVIRRGKWKLALCAGSGGWSDPREPAAHRQGLPPVQLYDMEADPSEQHNMQASHPAEVGELLDLLKRYVDTGRSTPGTTQPNEVPIDLWKLPAAGNNKAAAPSR